jgi:alkylated DNA repair dioxygenase AlkB
MDLFTNSDQPENLLPYDGTSIYYGTVIQRDEANQYLSYLLNEVAWENDKAIIYGKLIITKRKAAWYGDRPFKYTYSKTTKTALPWTPELLELKAIAEKTTGETYNSCLLNLYHDGSEGMAWHSDAEKDLIKEGAIASLSFGAERKFSFKHKETKENVSVMLQHGSALVMKGTTQSYWLHSIAKSTKTKSPRVNLTFRTINI